MGFNFESFTPIQTFSNEYPLHPAVQSDHAEVAIKTSDNVVINVWNISNPTYHGYFKYGPFKSTHLYVEKPYEGMKMNDWLDHKLDEQIETIAERFVAGKVNIQVIVEGTALFYDRLTEKIKKLGHENFHIERTVREDFKENIIGILVDTSRFSMISTGCSKLSYKEVQDANKEKVLELPSVKVRDLNTNRDMQIIGVHVNGCKSQFPESGLETLAKIIQAETDTDNCDTIALGDFNTPPENVRTATMKALTSSELLVAPYPTHVNPRSEAGNYDQVLIVKNGSGLEYEMLSETHLSIASQKLVESIEKARI